MQKVNTEDESSSYKVKKTTLREAETHGRKVSYQSSARASEMRVYNSLMRGYTDVLDGNMVDAVVAEQQILAAKGWA